MGISQDAIVQRREAILKLLETPHSIQALADKLGVSYHTARLDVMTLMTVDQVKPATATDQHGKRMFILGGKRAMPTIFIPATERHMRLDEIAISYGMNPDAESKSMASVRFVFQAALELCYEANRAWETGQQPDKKRMAELRKNLMIARKFIDSQSAIADQIINNFVLWDTNKIAGITQDLEFDGAKIEEAYENYLNYVNGDDSGGEPSPAVESDDD